MNGVAPEGSVAAGTVGVADRRGRGGIDIHGAFPFVASRAKTLGTGPGCGTLPTAPITYSLPLIQVISVLTYDK
jgi:hypothetical protein